MATNIEQIFRSFVVTKFREIQEQQFGSGKLGNQHNGEINTSGQVNSDDTIQSIESLQNDSLVQKIEQVLSEVLGTEPRYKSGDGDDIERNNLRSIKRGLPEDVQDEIPRKKSKKDKKHKDKKKKKKRKKEKKEKKYKKHAKETDVQQKECGDMQLISHSNLENSGSLLNTENDSDTHSGPTLKEVSPLINEKTVYENLNSAMLDNMSSSDTSKLDISEEDSTLISIQEVSEVKLTNEKELEDDNYHPNVTVTIHPEDKYLSDAVCTVVGVLDIKEVEQPKLILEATGEEYIPESSPFCVRGEPEHLETRLESTAMKVTCINSVTESPTLKNLKETVSTSFEPTGYKLTTLPLESNAEAKDSVTTLGFLAMVVGKDFEATSEFLNTAKVKASERSPKHSSRQGDSVHDSEKSITMKGLHKPQQFGTEGKDLETAPEAVHAVPEKDSELAVVNSEEVSEFDVQKYNRATLGTEVPKEMKELREAPTLIPGLSESEKNAGYLPIQKDAKDLQRAPLLENMTRIDSEEHLPVVVLETTNLEVNSDFTEIDKKCLKAKSAGLIESENWKPAPESFKAKSLECVQEFEKAEQINYLETSLETVIENRGNSEIIQHSLALFNVKVPENASQLKEVNVAETIQTEVGKTQNLESSKYVALRNKENKNAEKLKNIPETLMIVNNLENSSSQCIEEIKIVKETSQPDLEAQKKDFKIGLEPEEREVDAGSGSLQMIFANYSEHSLELYTETKGVMELKNTEAVLKSLHKSSADNFEPPCAKEIKYVKSTESEAVTEANDLQENLKSLHKHVKNVETASKSIALPTVTYTETLEGISNRKQSETESHFVPEIEQKSSADTTDLGLISRSKEVIETNSSKIGESDLLGKSQDPLFVSKALHEIDVISSEKNNQEFKGIAIQEEPGKSLAAAIDPREFFKLKNLVLVELKDDFPFGSTVKQFKSVSESLEQNQEQLEHTETQTRKECLDSVPDLDVKCARTSSEILYSDEFNIQKNKKLEDKIETTGLMEAPESLHLSERDLIVPTSDSGTKISEYGPETLYLAKINSKTTPKSYEIQVKDSKTTSESKMINVKDLNIDSEPLLQTGVEIKEYIPGCKSVVSSESMVFTAETPPKNEMLPESKITKLQKSNTVLRSEGLTYEHLKTPPASLYVINTEDLEMPPKSKELDVIEKQGVVTSLFASVESADVSEESFEHNYKTDVKKTQASQKSINVESMGKEKMNDEPVQPFNKNDANVSKPYMSSNHAVRAQIIEDRRSVADKESVSGITSESGTELVLKLSGLPETITGQEREKLNTPLPEFMVDLKESPNILDAQEMNLKAIQREKYTNSLYILESRDAADVSQSGSKVEPKSLRATMNYERLSDPVATAVQLKKPELTSSESVSTLEVTDTSKIPELKTTQTYLGVTGLKSTDTTAESCPLEIIDSDTQIQPENILGVKNFESVSETKYGLGTHPFKITSESEKLTQDQLSKAISDILSSGNMENLEQILKYRRNQERKDLESSQFDTPVASLTYKERTGISETTTQFAKATDIGSNISTIVPETTEKCSEIFLESIDMSNMQATNTNVELDNLMKKSPDIFTDNKSNSGFMDILELKSNNAAESVHMKQLEDSETVAVCKPVIEIKNIQADVQTSEEKEQMDFQKHSKSVLPSDTQNLERNSSLPQQKILETSLEPAKDFASVSECSSTKDLEQNFKSGFVAEGKAQEPTVEHVIPTRDKNAEMPQFSLEMKDSEATLESVGVANRKDLDVQTSSKEPTTMKPLCITIEDDVEVNQLETTVLEDSGEAVNRVHLAEKEDIKVGECIEAKNSEIVVQSEVIVKDKDLEVSLQESLKDSNAALNSSDIIKESEVSNLKDKKSEKISSKSKDKSKSGKKTKKSRSKSPSKSKKRKKKSRSRSTSRQVSRRARSRSKNDSSSKRKHSTSRHKSRSKSVDKKEKESSLRSRRRRSRTSDRVKSRSKSPDRRETSIRSRRRRSRSSNHKSRSRSVEKESARRRRRLSRSSDNRRSRSRSVDRREILTRSRRRRSRSSDRHKSRSRSSDKRETSVRTRRRRSQSSDRCRSRSKSFDRRDSSVRIRRRRSRSSDNLKSRSRSPDDKRESSVRRRGRRSRTPETRKSRSRSVDRREISGRGRRRRSRSSDNRKSRSRSVEKRESSVRIRRRRSRSSDNRRSKSKSVDKRETSVRTKRRRSVSSDRKSRSRSVDKRETSARSKRRRSRSSDHKSRSKSVENIETAAKSKRRRSKSTDKSRTKSVEKGESTLNSRHRRSKSSDRPRSKSKSRSKSSERRKDKDSVDESRGKRSKYRSKSKSIEKTDGTESLEATLNNREKSPEQQKSRSRSKSIDKAGEKERSRRSRSKGSKSSESRSRRRRTVSRSRRNRSQSLTQKRTRSKSVHRSQSRSRTRSRSCSRRWRRTRSRSVSRQRSLSRKRQRRSRRNRSRSTDRRRRRSDSRDSYRISLRLRSRSRTPVRLRSTGRRRSASKSPDHRRSRSSSRSPKRLTDLDKAQLLEIAKANAAAMCAKAGVPLPPSLMPVITPEKKEEKVTQKSAKETILELTEKCKKIAQSQEDDVIVNKPHVSDEEEEEHPFINHPFKLNEPKPIFFNLSTPTIKPTPPKNQVTLTKEFPVSSGSQHRKKEADSAYGEWVPVEKNKDENKDDVFPNPANLEPVDISSALNERTIAQKRLTENTFDLEAMCLLNRAQERIDAWAELNSIPGHFTGTTGAQVLTSEQLSNSGPQAWVKKVFTLAPRIGSWRSHLCGLFLALNESGQSLIKLLQPQKTFCEQEVPGIFVNWIHIGDETDIVDEHSIIAKQDQFLRAAPVSGGMGAQLMRKMGWREGEGLGKNKEGNKEPILVDFKTDRKGLVAVGEKTQKRHGPFSTVKDLSGKHPVSALLEVCNKRRWSPPVFVLVNDNRPEYRKHFLFKVMVNGVEHKPSFVSPNKKHAKATAATVALQALGLVPKELLANTTNFRSASHN